MMNAASQPVRLTLSDKQIIAIRRLVQRELRATERQYAKPARVARRAAALADGRRDADLAKMKHLRSLDAELGKALDALPSHD
jgi:hypothetical protein